MGRYINNTGDPHFLPAIGKAQHLLEFCNATRVEGRVTFRPDLVCVVENGPFDAAAWADTEEEMNVFLRPDGRRKTWLVVPNVQLMVD